MTTHQFILFAILLALPSLYQRTKFVFMRSAFMVTRLRSKSGVQIHHGHWGLLIVFLSSIALAFGYHGWPTIIGIGYGWGLILDEIVPLLKMPSVGREIELDVYAKYQKATFIVIAVVVVATVALFCIVGPHYEYQLPPGYIG